MLRQDPQSHHLVVWNPKRDLATLKNNQEILRRVERREANNPLAFFERLFR